MVGAVALLVILAAASHLAIAVAFRAWAETEEDERGRFITLRAERIAGYDVDAIGITVGNPGSAGHLCDTAVDLHRLQHPGRLCEDQLEPALADPREVITPGGSLR